MRYEDLPSIGEPAMELVGEVTHYESWKGGDVWYLTWEDEKVRLGERRREKAKRKRNWGVCFLFASACIFLSLFPFLFIHFSLYLTPIHTPSSADSSLLTVAQV